MTAIRNTDFSFTGQTAAYRQSPRHVHHGDDLMVAVVSDASARSTWSYPGIPFQGRLEWRGQPLLERRRRHRPTWNVAHPTPTSPSATNANHRQGDDPRVPTGHAWAIQGWPSDLCGAPMPEGMKGTTASEPIIPQPKRRKATTKTFPRRHLGPRHCVRGTVGRDSSGDPCPLPAALRWRPSRPDLGGHEVRVWPPRRGADAH